MSDLLNLVLKITVFGIVQGLKTNDLHKYNRCERFTNHHTKQV